VLPPPSPRRRPTSARRRGCICGATRAARVHSDAADGYRSHVWRRCHPSTPGDGCHCRCQEYCTARLLRRYRRSRYSSSSSGTARHVYVGCRCAGRLRRHAARECQQRRLVLWVHVVVVWVHVVEVRQRCLQQCRIEAPVHAHSGGGWCSLTCRRALRSDSSDRPRCHGDRRCNGHRARCRCPASACMRAASALARSRH
jgi:hypothetical protein